jgi:hypothetical protein
MVADSNSGELLQGATLSFRHVDTSVIGFGPAAVTFTSSIQSVVSGATVPNTQLNYWLDPYAPENPGDATATFVGPCCVRTTVSAPGHTTRHVYRNHQYSSGLVQTNVPYSGGPYSIPSSWNTQNGEVSEEDFFLYPTSTHPLWPDLIVDVRSLAFNQVGTVFQFPPALLVCPGSKCLAFGLNVANVSSGPFQLTSNTSSPGVITQIITQTAGPAMNVAISGGMLVPEGNAWHVANLVKISLRGPIASGVCDTEATASSCPIVVTSAKDVCLEGSGGVFDTVYGGTLAQQGPMNCWPNGNASSTTGPLHPGLAPGLAEFYAIGNPENLLDVSSVASGQYWLEAQVNPDGLYQEADTSNNIARVQVSL